jgi:uncharacterized protein YidB (DUF937 family)
MGLLDGLLESGNLGAIAGILGDDTPEQLAKMAGIDSGQAGSMLASVLPALVNRLTPQGRCPTRTRSRT